MLGLFYAKARMYDADNRRFTSVDPVKGNVVNPLTLVQYLYVVDSPLVWVDPLGNKQVESDSDIHLGGTLTDKVGVLNPDEEIPNTGSISQECLTRQVLVQGSQGAAVKTLQEILIRYGFLPEGENDGIFGSKTAVAVKVFQRANGLDVDGIVGPDTWKALLSQTGASSNGYANDSAQKPLNKDSANNSITPILSPIPEKSTSFLNTVTDFCNGFASGVSIVVAPNLGFKAQIAAIWIDKALNRPTVVDFYSYAVLWAQGIDSATESNATDKKAFYAGRMVGDILVSAAGVLQIIGGIKIIGAGAALSGGGAMLTSTGDPVIGVPAVVVGTAVVSAGAAVAVDGAAIAAVAANNLGKDSGKFFDSFGCEDANDSSEITRGTSRAPKEGTPGSIYEQVNQQGQVLSRTVYGDNGRPAYRDDLIGRPHFDRASQQYIMPHRHWYTYNENGLPNGSYVTKIPES